uniref:ABC transporter permease n=1 Tax=Ndongobacter massiliensis TaxID=1871025 RepID=UPI0009315FA6|nr:ABC transporter permease [Ndongobacter massiliensis]
MNYIAVLFNSTIRSTTPILLAALGCAVCSQSGVFNIALEGQLLIGSFAAIAADYYTQNVFLAVLIGMLAGTLVGVIVAILQVKYHGADMVVGTSINLLVLGMTSLLLNVLFGVRGKFVDPTLKSLHKINLPLIRDIPFFGRMVENLTIVDYLSYIMAVLLFLYLYRTVSGFHVRSVGINEEAASSMGINPTRERMKMVILSGALCGLGGAVLSVGQVTMFLENMTSGRGYIAMAASSMGASHPIFIIITSLFFGIAQAVGSAIQNTVPAQITMAIPYIATILALMVTYRKNTKTKKSLG